MIKNRGEAGIQTAPALVSLVRFSIWIRLRGVSLYSMIKSLRSFMATSAHLSIRFELMPPAARPTKPMEAGAIIYASTMNEPLDTGAAKFFMVVQFSFYTE